MKEEDPQDQLLLSCGAVNRLGSKNGNKLGVQNLQTVLQSKIRALEGFASMVSCTQNTGLGAGLQGVLPAATACRGEFNNRRKSRSAEVMRQNRFSRQNPPPYDGGCHS